MKLKTAVPMQSEKKELLIFLLIAFGVPLLMGIPLAIMQSLGKDVSAFGYAQMLCPAAGLMLAKLICDKERAMLPKVLFGGFLLLTLVMLLWCFSGLFTYSEIATSVLSNLITFGSIIIGVFIFLEKNEKYRAHALGSRNWKISFVILLIFIVLYFARSFIYNFLTGAATPIDVAATQLFSALLSLAISFITTFALFLGEEYGWRCYFQPLLQQKFGLIKGVLIFGILWGLWHFQLDLFYYPTVLEHAGAAAATPVLHILLIRQVTCISLGIFFAYAYMKTNNLWLPILLHLFNNGLSTFVSSNTGASSSESTWLTVALWALVNFAIFVPFLCTKVFRKRIAVLDCTSLTVL